MNSMNWAVWTEQMDALNKRPNSKKEENILKNVSPIFFTIIGWINDERGGGGVGGGALSYVISEMTVTPRTTKHEMTGLVHLSLYHFAKSPTGDFSR